MGRSDICVALFPSMRHARLCLKGTDLCVKPSAPPCSLTLPLYLGLKIEQSESQDSIPGGVASVLVEIQIVPIAVKTV